MVFFLLLSGVNMQLQNALLNMPKLVIKKNYGVVLRRVGGILNGVSMYPHTFGIPMPLLNYSYLQNITCNSEAAKLAHCGAVNEMITEINRESEKAFQDIGDDVRRTLAAIPALKTTRRVTRRKRSVHGAGEEGDKYFPPDFCDSDDDNTVHESAIGHFFESLFGTVTEADMKAMGKHICKLLDMMNTNDDQIAELGNDIGTVSKNLAAISSKLTDGITAVRDELTQTVSQFQTQMDNLKDTISTLTGRVSFLEVMQEKRILLMAHLAAFRLSVSEHYSEIQRWLLGIQTMLNGYLPVELVPPSEINKVLSSLKLKLSPSGELSHLNLQLAYDEPSYYYRQKSLAYARTEQLLFITLRIPLSTVPGLLAVYKVKQIHLPISDYKAASTYIEALPHFFAVSPSALGREYYTTLSSTDFSACEGANDVKLCGLERSIKTREQKTCISSVYFDDLQSVKTLCDVRYEEKQRPAEAIALGQGKYFLHDPRIAPIADTDPEKPLPEVDHSVHWTGTCVHPHSKEEKSFKIKACNSCIVTVKCGCLLQGEDFLIPRHITGCPVFEEGSSHEDGISKDYTLNLHVAARLYSANILSLFKDEPISKPDTYIGSHRIVLNYTKFDRAAEAEQINQANLSKVIEAFQRNATIYKDQSSALMERAKENLKFSTNATSVIKNVFDENIFGFAHSKLVFFGTNGVSFILAFASIALGFFNRCLPQPLS